MVKQAIVNLERAMSNVRLLETGKEEDRAKYFDDNFDSWLGTSLAYNQPLLVEYLEKEARGESLEGLLPGQENSRIFSTFVAHIPDIDNPTYVRKRQFANWPKFSNIQELDVESIATIVKKKTHDGAIGWGKSTGWKAMEGDYIITSNGVHIAFNGFWDQAANNANQLTGRNEEALDDAIAPLVRPALINVHGKRKPTVGLMTRNAACVALAIPGAVTITPKGTFYNYGLPRVTRYGSRGIECEGSVMHVPERDLHKYQLPQGEAYLVPERELAVVKKRYAFDPKLKAVTLTGKPEILSPEQLGLRQSRLSKEALAYIASYEGQPYTSQQQPL
jgi:hypothetical protein